MDSLAIKNIEELENDEEIVNVVDTDEEDEFDMDETEEQLDKIYDDAYYDYSDVQVQTDKSTMYEYLRDVSHIDRMTPAEEVELGKKVKYGTNEEKKYAIEQLVEHNLRLVIYVSNQFRGCNVDKMDLISEGNLGLIKAANRFDYELGYKFGTYALYWIRQHIQRYINNHGRMIRLPVNACIKATKMNKAVAILTTRLGRRPTVEEIADECGITHESAFAIYKTLSDTLSLDQQISTDEDGETTIGDFVSSENYGKQYLNEGESSFEMERKIAINNVLKKLNDKELFVIQHRFGLGKEDQMTLEQVGQLMGVSRERVRQIENSALRKLRNPTNSRLLEVYV